MKRHIHILVLLLLPLFALGQGKSLAMINDPDGYTNVRNGKGTEYKVVTKLLEGELFYCTTSDDAWWEVQPILSAGTTDKLYVHKSRILLIRSIPAAKRREIIKSNINEFVVLRQSELVEGTPEAFEQSSSYLAETKVEPILWELAAMVNQKWHDDLMASLFRYLENSQGSASEVPGDVLAEIFWHNSGKLKKMIEAETGDFYLDLVDRLAFGFENFLYSNSAQNESYDEKVAILKAQLKEMQ